MTQPKCEERQHRHGGFAQPRCWLDAGHTGPHTTIYGHEFTNQEPQQ